MIWTLASGPATTGPEHELASASWTVTWRRTDKHDLTVALKQTDPLLPTIQELLDDAWVSLDGMVIGRFRFGPSQDDPATATLSGADYRERLRRIEVYDLATHHWVSTDPVDAAWTLVQQGQTLQGANLGVTRGVHPSGQPLATIDVEAGTMVGAALDTLAGLGSGFDWDVTPTGLLTQQLDIWRTARGTDRGIIVDYGGVASDFTRQVDPGGYANVERMTGQAPSGGGAQPDPVTVTAADIATRPEGRWTAADTSTQTTTGALTADAQRSLAVKTTLTASWTAKLRRGWWQGPAHVWLGDPVTWVCRRGRLDVVESLTVEEVAATFTGDSEQPSVQLTLGVPNPDRRFNLRAVSKRLDALELR